MKQHNMASPGGGSAKEYKDLLLDAICVVDADGNCVNVSGACERIFGYTPAEMVGKNMLDLVHPDDLERTLQSIDRVMAGYLQSYFENRYVRKDGDVVCISWSAAWSEEHQVRVGVARDITKRCTDDGALVARQLLPEPLPCWTLSGSPRSLLSPDGVSIALSVQDHAVLLVLMSARRRHAQGHRRSPGRRLPDIRPAPPRHPDAAFAPQSTGSLHPRAADQHAAHRRLSVLRKSDDRVRLLPPEGSRSA